MPFLPVPVVREQVAAMPTLRPTIRAERPRVLPDPEVEPWRESMCWAMFLGLLSIPAAVFVVRSDFGFYLFVGSCSLGVWLVTTILFSNRVTRHCCMRLGIV